MQDASVSGVHAEWTQVGTLEGSEGWVLSSVFSSCCRGLPASPDSFDIANQILGQAYPKNLRKEEKESQMAQLLLSLRLFFAQRIPFFLFLSF